MARQWRALVLGFPSSDRGAVLCGGATGETSRSRASSVSSRRVTCAPCALLSAAHDTEPIFGSRPRAMRERNAGIRGGERQGTGVGKASDAGLCVVFVPGLSASYIKEEANAPVFSVLF